jgi:hypothetical protein
MLLKVLDVVGRDGDRLAACKSAKDKDCNSNAGVNAHGEDHIVDWR